MRRSESVFNQVQLFALIKWGSGTFARLAFVIIAERRSQRTALFTIVQFLTTGIHLGIDPCIAPLPSTAIGILLADAGAFEPVYRAAFALFAGIVVVTGTSHFDRVRRVAAG